MIMQCIEALVLAVAKTQMSQFGVEKKDSSNWTAVGAIFIIAVGRVR